MVVVNPVGSTAVEPMPKYGHLSKTHPEFEPLQDAANKDFAALWQLPLDEFKGAWKAAPPALLDDSPEIGKDITIECMKIPVRDGTKIEIQIYKPANLSPNALLNFNVHGGGWVVGNHSTEEAQCRKVACDNKAVVVSPDYRMAPEFRFPHAVNDCLDALKWCKENASILGANPDTIVLSGGSAGGNLAAVLAQLARDENIGGIIGQILNIPATCHPDYFPHDEFEGGSFQQNRDACVVDAPRMRWFWEQYMPNPRPDALASPLLADNLRDLPPALIQIAGADPLRDEGFAYAERLMRAGVRTTVRVYPGLPHGFYFFKLTAQREYLQEVSDFIKGLRTAPKAVNS